MKFLEMVKDCFKKEMAPKHLVELCDVIPQDKRYGYRTVVKQCENVVDVAIDEEITKTITYDYYNYGKDGFGSDDINLRVCIQIEFSNEYLENLYQKITKDYFLNFGQELEYNDYSELICEIARGFKPFFENCGFQYCLLPSMDDCFDDSVHITMIYNSIYFRDFERFANILRKGCNYITEQICRIFTDENYYKLYLKCLNIELQGWDVNEEDEYQRMQKEYFNSIHQIVENSCFSKEEYDFLKESQFEPALRENGGAYGQILLGEQ